MDALKSKFSQRCNSVGAELVGAMTEFRNMSLCAPYHLNRTSEAANQDIDYRHLDQHALRRESATSGQ